MFHRIAAIVGIADLLLAAACLAAATLAVGATSVQCGWLSSAGLAVAGGSLFALVRRQRRETQLAQLYLDRIASQSFESLPAISPRSSWHAPLERVREAQQSVHSKISEAEHARTALEVRQRRLVAENERMGRILKVVSEPLLAVDSYDQILLANRAAEQLFGLADLPAEKRVLGQIQHCERLLSLIRDTSRRKSPTQRYEELEIEEPDGTRRWYCAAVASLAAAAGGDQSGESDGVVTVLRDISALKQVRQHNAEFVSNASHEMKAPLAGIRAYVELLADGDAEDEETREEFLRVINSQTDRLQRLVENLLNLARIEAGVVQVNKQHQGLNEVLIEAFNVIQPSAQGKGIEMTHHLSQMYLGVHLDRDLMLQCVINLLSNAVKYTAPGGRVTLRSRLLGDEIQFEVQDSGVGLSPEDCEKVFEKFYRVEKDKNMASGTGLGLPLAKYIAEDVHGGRLTLKSQLGVGSTFLVTLPAAGH